MDLTEETYTVALGKAASAYESLGSKQGLQAAAQVPSWHLKGLQKPLVSVKNNLVSSIIVQASTVPQLVQSHNLLGLGFRVAAPLRVSVVAGPRLEANERVHIGPLENSVSVGELGLGC